MLVKFNQLVKLIKKLKRRNIHVLKIIYEALIIIED